MIKAVHLHNLRDAEYLNFIAEFITLTEEHQSEKLQIEAELENIKQQQLLLENTFKQQRSSTLTVVIRELDQERDRILKGMQAIIKGNTYSFDLSMKAAAEKLQFHLKQYGSNIIRLNYLAETAVIDNILADWEKKDDLKSALALLGLDSWKDYLKMKNIAFANVHLDRTKEYGKTDVETLRALRKEVNEVYFYFKKKIEAYATITPSEKYTNYFNTLNALIDQYNQLVKNRKTSAGPTLDQEQDLL